MSSFKEEIKNEHLAANLVGGVHFLHHVACSADKSFDSCTNLVFSSLKSGSEFGSFESSL